MRQSLEKLTQNAIILQKESSFNTPHIKTIIITSSSLHMLMYEYSLYLYSFDNT